jgi:hypothetical protein
MAAGGNDAIGDDEVVGGILVVVDDRVVDDEFVVIDGAVAASSALAVNVAEAPATAVNRHEKRTICLWVILFIGFCSLDCLMRRF